MKEGKTKTEKFKINQGHSLSKYVEVRYRGEVVCPVTKLEFELVTDKKVKYNKITKQFIKDMGLKPIGGK